MLQPCPNYILNIPYITLHSTLHYIPYTTLHTLQNYWTHCQKKTTSQHNLRLQILLYIIFSNVTYTALPQNYMLYNCAILYTKLHSLHYTLHNPTPYTTHPTLHNPAIYTLRYTTQPYTINHTIYSLHSIPYTRNLQTRKKTALLTYIYNMFIYFKQVYFCPQVYVVFT